MTTLAINDLATSKELDREAMRSHLGGRGLGRSALFAFFLPGSSAFAPDGAAPFTFNQTLNTNITNTLNQIFVDTLQFNQLNQLTEITDSPNATVDQFGNQRNGNFKALGFPVAA
ncbi:MAG: hypothetical protein ACRERU_01135 [Methylococcales bacterium]